MNDIEKKAYYANVFHFYQELLTEKQQNIFSAYYDDDYSLVEIAEELGITRNAVYDTLNKVVNLLDEYENKLHLYKNNKLLKSSLDKLKNHTDEEGLKIIKEIEEME